MDIEQMNVMQALTAAEYSRRECVLNFAASKNTQLLVPRQKTDAIKGAEEWVVSCLYQNGYDTINNEFFKYTVDARLWTTMGKFCCVLLTCSCMQRRLSRSDLLHMWTS
jgi:hypothetical protein